MSNRAVVACIPQGAPGYVPGSDYQLVQCPSCGRRCWLGPVGKQAVDSGHATVLCAICTAKQFGAIIDSGEMRVLDPVAKARLDLSVFPAALNAMTDEQIERLGRD